MGALPSGQGELKEFSLDAGNDCFSWLPFRALGTAHFDGCFALLPLLLLFPPPLVREGL